MTDLGFIRWGRQRPGSSQKPDIWPDFCRKLHENERPCARPLGSASGHARFNAEEEYSLRLCFPSFSSVSVSFRALIFAMIFAMIFACQERGRYDKIAYSSS